jgi:lambda family phage minor tail protein L
MSVTGTPALVATSQSLEPGDLICLYRIELDPIGVPTTWAFVESTSKTAVVYQGVTYTPVDVKVEGFEYSGQGKLPEPTLSITNATRLLSGAAVVYKDLIGARFVRIRTYKHFLDGQPAADPNSCYAPDVFTIAQKTKHDKTEIVWKLQALMDQEGRKLPGRTILRDFCPWRYRRWNSDTASFDYTKVVGCPYTGTAYFDQQGVATTAALDKCGKRESDCKLRFGTNAALPYGGFPGVARVRV